MVAVDPLPTEIVYSIDPFDPLYYVLVYKLQRRKHMMYSLLFLHSCAIWRL